MQPIVAGDPDGVTQIELDLLEMASRAELMVTRAADALVSLDNDRADEVIASDDKVDELDSRIEASCLDFLAKGSSDAGVDFIRVGTMLKIATDVERVGDLAVEIARCAKQIDRELGQSSHVDIHRLSAIARSAFHLAVEAYVRKDLELVHRADEAEEAVDALFQELQAQIHDHMRHRPDEVVALSFLLLGVNHLERIGDHAHNISSRVAYLLTGELRIHEPAAANGYNEPANDL